MSYDPSSHYRPQASVDSDISQTTTVPPFQRPNGSEVQVDVHRISRTPSPTPSETEELKKNGLFDWKAMAKWRYWVRREWLWYYVAFVIIGVITILFTVYHKQIVKWLQPDANKIKELPAGWLIPIAIFVIISFPPLFGQEILAILCGLVWGLWIGFAIVAAGTFFGELANFYAFRYCCATRGEKLEKTKLQYACLARVVREGGFKVALIARFSAIPGHFTTAVFSTCGMSVWTFALAAFLSLPKQFLTVYLGVALEASEDGQSSTRDTIIRDVVIGITTVVTVVAMWYIYRLMNKAKPEVIYARRKARQTKMQAMDSSPYGSFSAVDLNARKSESELPLTANFQNSGYQQWDNHGRAVGYAPDPTLYAPQPQRPVKVGSQPVGSSATPSMSERTDGINQSARKNTGGSPASWDAQAHAGPNSYPMSRQSPLDNAAYSQPPKLPPPVTTNAPVVFSSHVDQTPTQAQFPYPGDPARAISPRTAPNSYSTQQVYPPSANPPQLPSDAQRQGGHLAAPTDSSYHSAYSGHGQQPSSDDPYTGYR